MENQLAKIPEQEKQVTHLRNLAVQYSSTLAEISADGKMLIAGKMLPETISQAVETPQLSVMKVEVGAKQIGAFLVKSLNDACIMTNSQIHAEVLAMLAESILKDYWFMHFGEILIALSNGCKGRYGQIYGQLNYQTIQGWLAKYCEEKESFHFNSHMNTKTEGTIGSSARTCEPKTEEAKAINKVIGGINAIGMKLKADEKYFENNPNPLTPNE